jgi:hypothetical protein
MIRYTYYFESTRTGMDSYGQVFFIEASKNGQTLKTIEIFKKKEVTFSDTKKKSILISNPLLVSDEINDYSGNLTLKEVKSLVSQIDNTTIFSKTYK